MIEVMIRKILRKIPAKTLMIMLLGAALLAAAGCTKAVDPVLAGQKITVYKSEFCGCCGGYVEYMQKSGADIEVMQVGDIAAVKQEHNIPEDMSSCHTSVVGDYVVEGHVPMEAVKKLLEEKPDIRGIALPGMQPGSPGMPGVVQGKLKVMAMHKDGSVSEFMAI